MDNTKAKEKLALLVAWVIVDKPGELQRLTHKLVGIIIDDLHDFHVVLSCDLNGILLDILLGSCPHFFFVSPLGKVGTGVRLQVLAGCAFVLLNSS